MEEKKSIYEKLSLIQNEMKVGKNNYNKFGEYNYRSAEDILAEAKKICCKYRTTLILTDDIKVAEARYYVVANAILMDWDSRLTVEVTAMAREEETKKGMDSSQVTGSCSSYARKYALNGLFNLDDTKDADTDEQHEIVQNAQTRQQKSENNDKLDEIRMRCFKAQNELQKLGIDTHSEAFCEHLKAEYKISSQDIPNLNGNGLVALIKAYGAIYKENAKA